MTTYHTVMLPVDPVVVGHEYDQLPLHCTALPWLKLGYISEATFLLRVKQVASYTAPVELVSDVPAQFGPMLDIPVFTLKKELALMELHDDLLRQIKHDDGHFYDSAYIGYLYYPRGYCPHVTTDGERSFPTGSRHVAKSLYVVRITHGQTKDTKMILADYPFATD